MIRHLSALALGGWLMVAGTAAAASFRPNVTVDGTTVTLGDLFDDAGDKAGQIVAQAPEPGRRMIFDAHALQSIAQGYGLDWRPASPRDRTVVERTAVLVGGDQVESAVSAALAQQGASQPFAVIFDQRRSAIALPTGSGALAVQSMTYDPEQKRFSGTLTATGPAGPTAIEVSGRIDAVVQVPVLNRVVDEDQIIGIADLDLVPMPAGRLARDTILKSEDLVGRTVLRALQPNRPLRPNDLKRDLVVKRGETVTIALDDPNLSLTAQGRALTDAAAGEPVKVLNIASSRMIEGIAAGQGLVTIPDMTVASDGAADTSTSEGH